RGQLTLVMVATIAVALLTMTLALLYRDLAEYRSTLGVELTTQARIMEQLAAPAMAFDDRQVAQRNLAALGQNPKVETAALYAFDGSLFASYARDGAMGPPLRAPRVSEARLAGDRMELVHEIWRDG